MIYVLKVFIFMMHSRFACLVAGFKSQNGGPDFLDLRAVIFC